MHNELDFSSRRIFWKRDFIIEYESKKFENQFEIYIVVNMFCALTRQHNNTDHVILQVSCYELDKLTITKDEELIEVADCEYSFIISGGFEPGVYSITSHNQHVEFFIMQHGKELESGTINGTLTVKIDRYKYVIME